MNTVIKHTRRFIVLVVGATVIVTGLLMLVLPGPGIVVLLIGLAILASEFVWAQRLLDQAKGKAEEQYKRLPFFKSQQKSATEKQKDS